VYKNHLEAEADANLASEYKTNDYQHSIQPFLINCPKFENCPITWLVAKIQPLCFCENQSFRDMHLSLCEKAQA
jgi:hypothetical protein